MIWDGNGNCWGGSFLLDDDVATTLANDGETVFRQNLTHFLPREDPQLSQPLPQGGLQRLHYGVVRVFLAAMLSQRTVREPP